MQNNTLFRHRVLGLIGLPQTKIQKRKQSAFVTVDANHLEKFLDHLQHNELDKYVVDCLLSLFYSRSQKCDGQKLDRWIVDAPSRALLDSR